MRLTSPTTSRSPQRQEQLSRASTLVISSTPAPLARWADPYYWNKPIPKQALGPMLDVLTSWDGLWYLRIVRNGYPTSVRPHVTYDVADARARVGVARAGEDSVGVTGGECTTRGTVAIVVHAVEAHLGGVRRDGGIGVVAVGQVGDSAVASCQRITGTWFPAR